MSEEQIKQYIENQSDASDKFKIWDEGKEKDADDRELKSDSSE